MTKEQKAALKASFKAACAAYTARCIKAGREAPTITSLFFQHDGDRYTGVVTKRGVQFYIRCSHLRSRITGQLVEQRVA